MKFTSDYMGRHAELHSVDELCRYYSTRRDEYDALYDHFRQHRFGSAEEIAAELKSRFRIGMDPADAETLLNLPFEKIYRCPECRSTVTVSAEKQCMLCSECGAEFSLDDNYLCPLCGERLAFDAEAGALVCGACEFAASPQRFAKPKNNRLVNEIGQCFEAVSPTGYHLETTPLPDVRIYPNPVR